MALDLQQSEYFGVNQTGSVLWQAVATGATRRELINLIVERYGLAEGDAEGHVDRFVADLRERGLLEPSE